MSQFASALSVHPNSFEAAAECAGTILDQLDGNRPDLVVVACTPEHRRDFADVTAGIRKLLECDALIATVSPDVGGATRSADAPRAGGRCGFAVFAGDWGGGRARPLRLDAVGSGDGHRIGGWPDDLPATGTLLLFADPATFPIRDLLAICGRHAPGLEIIGGITAPLGRASALAIDDTVHEGGAVGVLLDPHVGVRSHLAIGSRPVGSPYTVTRAERNVITGLAGRAPLARMREAAACHGEIRADEVLADETTDLTRRMRLGIVVDEHRSEFGPGDFVLRDVLGTDPLTGALVLNEAVRTGQTVQFHLPVERCTPPIGGVAPRAALVFSHCVSDRLGAVSASPSPADEMTSQFGPIPIAAIGGTAEIGSVRGRAFVHSGASSIALFT